MFSVFIVRLQPAYGFDSVDNSLLIFPVVL